MSFNSTGRFVQIKYLSAQCRLLLHRETLSVLSLSLTQRGDYKYNIFLSDEDTWLIRQTSAQTQCDRKPDMSLVDPVKVNNSHSGTSFKQVQKGKKDPINS